MSKNVKTSLVFSGPQFHYLKCEAERQGISIAEVIRKAISEARPGFSAPEHKVKSRLPNSAEVKLYQQRQS